MTRMDRGMGQDRGPGRRKKDDSTRRFVYCVVPARLALELHDPLLEHFSGRDDVEVIVERRRRDRRTDAERRRDEAGPPSAGERRRIRNAAGRRVADRRLASVLDDAPALPKWAARRGGDVAFVERFEPNTLVLEDVDTARLVIRIQAGDESGFATLYSRYFDRIYSYLRVTLRDGYEAEDATQQTFMKALEAVDGYELRTEPFRGWLFAIARNCGTDSLRRGGRVQVLDGPELDRRREEAAPPAGEPLFEWLSDRNLARDFKRLPTPQQQVLALRFLLDLSVRETAHALAFSEDNVKTLQSRALGAMRKRLAASGAGSTLAAV
jgi:RNA polymerase sigma-70 factor, ECF subfamily